MTNKINLSKRLLEIANFVPQDSILGDIGADHGYLISYLICNNIISKGYACDNKKGPYLKLKSTIDELGLNSQVECALKDGLTSLPEYVNTVSISGMGGDLICQILQEGEKYLSQINRFILAPQGGEENLRRYLTSKGFYIKEEKVVFDYKYYDIMVFEKGHQDMEYLDYKYGPILRKEKSSTFIEKYQKELEKLDKILKFGIDDSRKNELNSLKEEIKNIIE